AAPTSSRKSGTPLNRAGRSRVSTPLPAARACFGPSGVTGLFQGLPGLDDALKLHLRPTIAAVGVRVEAFQQLMIAGLYGGLVGAGLQVQVGQGGAFQPPHALLGGVGYRRFLGSASEQAEAVAP